MSKTPETALPYSAGKAPVKKSEFPKTCALSEDRIPPPKVAISAKWFGLGISTSSSRHCNKCGALPWIDIPLLETLGVTPANEADEAFPTAAESGMAVDLGLGGYYSHPKFYAGFSAHHLTAPRVSLGDKSQIKIHPIFYLTGGYNIQTRNPLISIQPSMQLQSDFTSTRLDVTGRLFYTYHSRVLSGGLTYSPDTSVTFSFGLTVRGVTLGYAYECFTSKIGVASGSHDLVVRYALDLNVFKKNRNLHKSVRIL